MLKLRKITKKYNNKLVLNKLDFELSSGCFCTIKGESGCGKSTLLNIIGTFESATSGEYYFEGKIIDFKNPALLNKIRKNKIGFIFQAYHLIPKLTVLQNITLPCIYSMDSFSGSKTRAKMLIEKLNLSHLINNQIDVLSGGEKQRACIARALINNPDLIIADEPTGNLDMTNAMLVMNILQDLKHLNKAIILVTHDVKIASMGDITYNLREGQLHEYN